MKSMKYLLPLYLLVLVLTGCNKDQRISRKIDGDWEAIVFMGSTPDPDEKIIFSFDKDKNGEGKGTIELKDNWGTEVYGIKYFIKNDYLTIIADEDPLVYTITSLDRKTIKLTDSYGDATILEKD